MKTAAILALVGAAAAVDTKTYNDIFINGQTYSIGDSQVDKWNDFPPLVETTPGAYTSVAFGSSTTAIGLSCVTQAIVDQISAAFGNQNFGFQVQCGINNWFINDCGASGYEIHANGPICGCTTGSAANGAARIRPADVDGNWGGLFQESCPGVTQALSLTFTAPQIVADPVFTGFDNSEYEFKGVAYEVFNLISDVDFQLNARFVPWTHGTFMGDLGFLLGDHSVELHANGTVLVDGVDMKVSQEYLLGTTTAVFDQYELVVRSPAFTVNARIMAENRVDFAVSANTPVHPHGVLGQTYGREHVEKAGAQGDLAEGVIEGTYTDYLVEDGLLGTKFAYNRFGETVAKAARSVASADSVLAFGRGIRA